jgi:putative DNA primase/helicase
MTLDARTIARVMGGDVNGDGALVPGPGHSPKDRSLSVKPDPAAREGFVVFSFAGDEVGKCRDHVKDKLGIASEPLSKSNGTGTGRRIVDTYDYLNEHHQLLFQAVRYEPKGFSQRRPDGRRDWTWKLDGVRRIPYRLPELIKATAAKKDLVVVEGEKYVEALRALDIAATTCPGGAGKWRDDYNQYFKDASVVIIGDNDEPGRNHARDVAKALVPVAARVRVLDLAACWPECPPKGDISDWLAAGGTHGQLMEWIERAPDYSDDPGHTPSGKSDNAAGFGGFEGAQGRPFSWPDPKPLQGGLEPVEEFDIAFLPASLGPWIEDISNRLQCPPDFVAVAAITALGSLIGRRAGIKPQLKTDWTEVPNIWGCFIGRPGMLKSPAMAEALKPLHHLEAEAAKDNEIAQQAYEAGLNAHKLRQQVKLSLEKEALKKNPKGPAGIEMRGGPGCLNSFSASISGASAGVRLPCGGAAG